MRVLIAGSRTITCPSVVEEAVRRSGFLITEVVSGACRGVDRLAEAWAEQRGIPVRRFPAEWARYGRSAGPRRNLQMIEHVTGNGAVIAIWDGVSHGTKHTIEAARQRGVPVFVLRVE